MKFLRLQAVIYSKELSVLQENRAKIFGNIKRNQVCSVEVLRSIENNELSVFVIITKRLRIP